MKNKIEGIVSFLLTVVLIAALIFVGWIVYKVMFDENKISTVKTDDTLVAVESDTEIHEKTEKKSLGETIRDIFVTESVEPVNYSPTQSQGKWFYEQLTDNQKIIYNGLQENKENMMKGNYKIEFGNKFSDILSKENGSKVLGDDYQTAIEAFSHDNVDLFYIEISKLYLNIETKKKAFSTSYNVYIAPEEGQTYFAKGFSSETEVRIAMKKIENVKEYVKSKLSGNLQKDIKFIHDYLLENVEYDGTNGQSGTYTIYGALVNKRCVCEGYARAFKYLADMAGIENVLMQGIAINTNGVKEKHAWNAVNMNGRWYLIDTTWDDPIILGSGIVLASTHYKYYLKGTNTFYKDHEPEYTFSENGKTFAYPKISTSDY